MLDPSVILSGLCSLVKAISVVTQFCNDGIRKDMNRTRKNMRDIEKSWKKVEKKRRFVAEFDVQVKDVRYRYRIKVEEYESLTKSRASAGRGVGGRAPKSVKGGPDPRQFHLFAREVEALKRNIKNIFRQNRGTLPMKPKDRGHAAPMHNNRHENTRVKRK